MKLTFVAKDPGSEPNGSPTLYRTDRGSWLVQGWVVTDPEALAAMAGRTCRRARVVSEPMSDYQRWTQSHARLFIDAGEDIRYVPRPRLTTVALPGSGDFYVFDNSLVLFLHYAGSGLNASFEITEDPRTVHTCQQAFESVWDLAPPFRADQPE